MNIIYGIFMYVDYVGVSFHSRIDDVCFVD